MSVDQRWDIVVRVTEGPLADAGEQTFRGPVVRVGADPGPGGLSLSGYRGVDARHATLSAYGGASATVAPVGANPVRVAPHANVDWRTLEPITSPVRLSSGNALHLGPVGRGATLVFVAARPFGRWEGAPLATEAPSSNDAVRVGRVGALRLSATVVGCFALATAGIGLSGVLVGGAVVFSRDVTALGPVEDGYEFYRTADPSRSTLSAAARKGLDAPFWDFVMSASSEAAGAKDRPGLEDPKNWDSRFFAFVTASIEQHVQAWNVFRRLEAIRHEYATVVMAMRDAGLPEVFAAIPYQETRYRGDTMSTVCANGWWQFMPETALRVERLSGLPFRVRNCRFVGAGSVTWSPSQLAPVPDAAHRAPYVEAGTCRISSCDEDDRVDLARSTAAAAYTLGEAWRDPGLRRSGAAVALTIASHNTGLDDGRFGPELARSTNIIPALKRFSTARGDAALPHVIGDSLTCPSHDSDGTCGSVLMAQTQHYVYPVVAQHLLAVCYYAMNHSEERAFSNWVTYVRKGGYCEEFEIPTAAEVRAGGS